jgi:IS30 family transposase
MKERVVFSSMGLKTTRSMAKNFLLSLGYDTQNKMAHLTLEQRYKIEIHYALGNSFSAISGFIGKNKSVISREIKRNADQRSGVYKADLADRKAKERHRYKPKRQDLDAEVEVNILYYLCMDYSPEQIVGRAKIEGKKMVSVERIYQYIWTNKRKGGRLYKYLRSKGKKYVNRGFKNGQRGIISNRVDIDQRLPMVEEKKRFGDLEIDLVIGKGHKGALLTINNRATGILFMDKVESKNARVVEAKAIKLLQDWKPWIKTITSDNGKEFTNHTAIANELHIDFFFAKPYHSWERGANENLNGLVRQYFPKDREFMTITKKEISEVINTLNNRPRKRFGYQTPNEILSQKINTNHSVAFIT